MHMVGCPTRRLLIAMAAAALLTSSLTAWASTPIADADALPPAAVAPTFTDVPADHPFADAIDWAATNTITNGFPDGTYRPTAPVTRQALAAFLTRYDNAETTLPACTTQPFPDVPTTSPFCAHITWLADHDIASGYADGGYHPTAPVSRQAAAAMLYHLIVIGGIDQPACNAKPFTDVAQTHPFCGTIAWLADRNITNGTNGNYQPLDPVSRQALAAFLHAFDPGCTTTKGCPRPTVPYDATGDRRAERPWLGAGGIVRQDIAIDPGWPVAAHGAAYGDWDGDGRIESAAEPVDGVWRFGGLAPDVTLPPPPCTTAEPGPKLLVVAGDYDGDRTTDPAWYCEATGTWLLEDGTTRTFGTPSPVSPEWLPVDDPSAGLWFDVAAPADYDGDGTAELGIYRPTDGTWWSLEAFEPGAVPVSVAVPEPAVDPELPEPPGGYTTGMPVGLPVPADWDGDGDDEPAIFTAETSVPVWEWWDVDPQWTMLPFPRWHTAADRLGPLLGWLDAQEPFTSPLQFAGPADIDGDRKTDGAMWQSHVSGADCDTASCTTSLFITKAPWSFEGSLGGGVTQSHLEDTLIRTRLLEAACTTSGGCPPPAVP